MLPILPLRSLERPMSEDEYYRLGEVGRDSLLGLAIRSMIDLAKVLRRGARRETAPEQPCAATCHEQA